MFAYAHAKWCVLRVVSNAYTTDSRQHTRLGRPKRQPTNSRAEEENPPPKSAPARKKAVEVLGCAARDERETYVTKAPKTISSRVTISEISRDFRLLHWEGVAQ